MCVRLTLEIENQFPATEFARYEIISKNIMSIFLNSNDYTKYLLYYIHQTMVPWFSPSPTSYLIILLSSRFHIILGSGDPSASQVILTELPSSTIISGEVFESIIVGGTWIWRHIVKTYKKAQYILKGKW